MMGFSVGVVNLTAPQAQDPFMMDAGLMVDYTWAKVRKKVSI